MSTVSVPLVVHTTQSSSHTSFLVRSALNSRILTLILSNIVSFISICSLMGFRISNVSSINNVPVAITFIATAKSSYIRDTSTVAKLLAVHVVMG